MKGFQKLTLAAAIAVAPFTQAMEAMDDSLLSEMTGQAGITIDVDLAMSIDAIKYVDSDGTTNGQGAITMRGLTIDGDMGAGANIAEIRGVTIDVDGTDGLVIGIAQVGAANTGIDISIDSIQINNGMAQGTAETAMNAVNDNTASSFVLTTTDLAAGTTGTALYTAGVTDMAGTADVGDLDTAAAASGIAGVTNANELLAVALDSTNADSGTAQGVIGTQATGGNAAAAAGGALLADAGLVAGNQAALGAALGATGAGNVGGMVIEDFRNYVEDTFVDTYNTRFDTALDYVGGGTGGGYVAAEIKIAGTGNTLQGTGGLAIEAHVGGLMSKAALTMGEDTTLNGSADQVHEFGVKDLAFFGTSDANLDGIQDTITAMKVNVDINVVDYDGFEGDNVAALKLSGLEIEGTIVMGDIYLGTQGEANDRSLGSVLIKDINMANTEVFIYGH